MSRKTRLRQANDADIWSKVCWSIALGRIGWEGLPPGTTPRQTELFICNGLAIGFVHQVAGAVILPGYWGGTLNLYGIPNKYVAFGYNNEMPSFDIDAEKAVPFYDNPSQKGIANMVDDTARQLSRIWQTIRINTKQQQIPWMYGGNEEEIQSIKAAVRAIDTDEMVLFVTRETSALMGEAKKAFPTSTPYIANELFTQLRQTMNNFLTNLGIDNMPIEKKERQIVDEVHGNQSLVMYNRNAAMREREQAAKRFNELTGLNIRPVWQGCTDCEEVTQDDTAV